LQAYKGRGAKISGSFCEKWKKNEKISINPLTERGSRNIIQKNIPAVAIKGRPPEKPKGGHEIWLRFGIPSCGRISVVGECVAAG
jgi:hypothetical protein